MNQVNMIGRLTRDPELKTTPNGVPVCSFGIAVPKDRAKDQADFFSCIAWRVTGENIGKYFEKGKMIAISGSIHNNTWTDKNGTKHNDQEITVERFFFCDSRSKPAEDFPVVETEDGELPF